MSNDENTQVADSSPAIRTSFPQENDCDTQSRTDSAQIPAEPEASKVKFPVRGNFARCWKAPTAPCGRSSPLAGWPDYAPLNCCG